MSVEQVIYWSLMNIDQFPTKISFEIPKASTKLMFYQIYSFTMPFIMAVNSSAKTNYQY